MTEIPEHLRKRAEEARKKAEAARVGATPAAEAVPAPKPGMPPAAPETHRERRRQPHPGAPA